MLIGGFQPFSLSDFPGRSAAIVFTQGCNYRCPYCHNRSLWSHEAVESLYTEEAVFEFLHNRRGKLDGVVVTGGEPSLQSGLAGFLSQVKSLGFAVKLDTNGSKPEVIRGLVADGLIDYVAMDVKAPYSKYDALCGIPVNINYIAETVKVIVSAGIPHHFRTTFYPTLLDENDIQQIQAMLPATSKYLLQKYREPLS
jgi:pyruvate formate lyase activating enzyme